MIIDERQRSIGNFTVGRLLPFRQKRQVGPFVFIDHMGPTELRNGKYLDVDQHPHIGLSTLTYLLEGEIEHRDSLGSVQLIRPGDAGFMTAGKGITHTERTPIHKRDGHPHGLHGYQIWVALPRDLEEMDPRFAYFPSESLPEWKEQGISVRLVAGQAFGQESPLTGYSHMFLAEIHARQESPLHLHGKVEGEVAIVIVGGWMVADGRKITARQMWVTNAEEDPDLQFSADTRLLLFGGNPLPEERFMRWNFTSSDRERLSRAREDWKNRRFPVVPGDHTYVPFP
jgi:redox-sensitive bicupin YhaK (pirin superfamily)